MLGFMSKWLNSLNTAMENYKAITKSFLLGRGMQSIPFVDTVFLSFALSNDCPGGRAVAGLYVQPIISLLSIPPLFFSLPVCGGGGGGGGRDRAMVGGKRWWAAGGGRRIEGRGQVVDDGLMVPVGWAAGV